MNQIEKLFKMQQFEENITYPEIIKLSVKIKLIKLII